MGLSDELRSGVGPWWERVVTHRFVMELGDNTLDPQVFQTYFDQDYLFLKDWAILLSLASAKAPDFEACRQLVGFLHLGLGGEESLFQEAFRQRGMSAQDVANLAYRPTTLHYSGYLRNIAYSGDFTDIVGHAAGGRVALPGLGPTPGKGRQATGKPLLPDLDRPAHQPGHGHVRGLAPECGRPGRVDGCRPVPVAAHFRGCSTVRAPVLGNGLSRTTGGRSDEHPSGKSHDHRRLGFGWRRRHPGRPQDLCSVGSLRGLGRHRDHRAKHRGSHRGP